ncbi:hypothetical protein [Paragemmobacter straminiformis]|uniref:Excalibur calcium-binding domain-containing protein n=1 Tax=Paragemmobacter straminiformis TaxID=2045119 RepID=A0A842I4P8_9RHOB|nr:hypothetical protein [Gemmobacter straminiformis]MBC2834393.1 hypothetical protein [Gemmobacter straminiformis]
MRTQAILALSLLGLAACSPPVPDSGAGAGVGFGDYNSYMREQAASAARQPVAGAPIGAAPTTFSTDAAAAAIDRATGVQDPNQPVFATTAPLDPVNTPLTTYPQPTYTQPAANTGPLDPNRPRGDAPSNIQTESGEMVHSNTGISDEQDFNAVSQRETIESDKERLARNRAQYQVIQPTAIPERTATGANIVEYALKTTNNPGTQVYSRSSLRLTDPLVACARYGSSDLAQQAFLEAGGPERDRKGLDPDGDGFACTWDPRPFRLQ